MMHGNGLDVLVVYCFGSTNARCTPRECKIRANSNSFFSFFKKNSFFVLLIKFGGLVVN
jgi:hypothetical protein